MAQQRKKTNQNERKVQIPMRLLNDILYISDSSSETIAIIACILLKHHRQHLCSQPCSELDEKSTEISKQTRCIVYFDIAIVHLIPFFVCVNFAQ